MAMSAAQVKAFKASAGFTPANILTVVAMTLAVIYLLWMAWMAYSQFKAWQNGQGSFYDLIFTIVRAAIVALLIGYTLI